MSDIKKDNKDLSLSTGDESFHLAFSSFLKNDYHSFVVQKTEKLASAIYVITGFLGHDDPLRTRLRTCAVDLVSSCTGSARELNVHESFGSQCLEIGTILRVAERGGLITPMNAKILCDEFVHLASFVREHRDRIFGNNNVQVGVDVPIAMHPAHAPRHIGQVQQEKKGTNNIKRHSNRRNAILALFNKKDKISIKDASAGTTGCSEKTIQRELLSLVEEGVLIKEGERRWSTYRRATE